MRIFRSSSLALNSWKALLPAAAFMLAALPAALHAQIEDHAVPAQITDEAAPETSASSAYAGFQYATITGTKNTINVTQLPILTSTGAVVYKNMVLAFGVDANGWPLLLSGYPQAVNAPPLQVSTFQAGNYIAPSDLMDGAGLVTVAGPGVTAGGATEWSLSASPGAWPGTYPDNASWYVGSLTSNPLYSRLKAAGITSTAYSYGILGDQVSTGNPDWVTGAILGFSQIGDTLTVNSFTTTTNGIVTDFSLPQDMVAFTLKQ